MTLICGLLAHANLLLIRYDILCISIRNLGLKFNHRSSKTASFFYNLIFLHIQSDSNWRSESCKIRSAGQNDLNVLKDGENCMV